MSEAYDLSGDDNGEGLGDLPAEAPFVGAVGDLPRITIGVFYERPDTQAAALRAADDRRMAKASLTVHEGGVPGAVAYYRDQATPDVLVVESQDIGQGLFDNLERLADVCSASTRVIVIGSLNDVRVYRQLIGSGVSDYLVGPLEPLQLLAAVAGLFANENEGVLGRVIACFGVRGGLGSSQIAHNIAWSVAQRHQVPATLVDFDLNFGTAGLDFNIEPSGVVSDALADIDAVDKDFLESLLAPVGDRLNVLASRADLDASLEGGEASWIELVSRLRRLAPVTVLDLPTSWNQGVRSLLIDADDVVLTVGPDLSSLRSLKQIYEFLVAARSNDAPPKIVINQMGAPKRREIPVKEFAAAAGGRRPYTIDYDPELFVRAANDGRPLAMIDSRSAGVATIERLAGALIGRVEASPAKAAASLVERFLKRKP